MPGGPARDECGTPDQLLRGLHTDDPDVIIIGDAAAAFGETEFRGNRVPVVLHHVRDAVLRRAFFASLGQEDNIPIELDAVTFEQ